MVRYAVDPPTLLRIVVGECVVHPDHRLVAPATVRSHTMDLLLARVREGVLSEREARSQLERLAAATVRLLGDRVSRARAWQLARDHGWETVRDAEYLAVTLLQADALVAEDPELITRARGLVPLADLSALTAPNPPSGHQDDRPDTVADLAFASVIVEWRGPAPYYFAPLPPAAARVIDALKALVAYWGVVPVAARIGDSEFTTSMFPRDDTWYLPVKDAVRRAERIGLGDRIEVTVHVPQGPAPDGGSR